MTIHAPATSSDQPIVVKAARDSSGHRGKLARFAPDKVTSFLNFDGSATDLIAGSWRRRRVCSTSDAVPAAVESGSICKQATGARMQSQSRPQRSGRGHLGPDFGARLYARGRTHTTHVFRLVPG